MRPFTGTPTVMTATRIDWRAESNRVLKYRWENQSLDPWDPVKTGMQSHHEGEVAGIP